MYSGRFLGEKRKGQFFIIGALFICILLFFGLSPDISISRTETEDMLIVAENLETEFPHALNIGVNSSDPVGTLYNFSLFSIGAAGNRRINLTSFWLVFLEGDGNVNVSAGNFMGSAKNFVINISGVSKNLYVDSGSVNSTLFSVSGYKFNVSIVVDNELTEATLLFNKTSIYSMLSLERGENIVRKEILA